MTTQMVGKTYRFDRGWPKVRFTFDSPSQGGFVVEEGGVIPRSSPRSSPSPSP